MITSESIKEIATALCKAQSEMSMPTLNKVNPFHKSKYADLPEMIKCMKVQFANNGLSLYQSPCQTDKGWVLVSRVMHISGEWIESIVPLLFNTEKGSAMQSLASAITYARRYALAALCNFAAEDDDDGNATIDTKKEGANGNTLANQVDTLVSDLIAVETNDNFLKLRDLASTLKPKLSNEQLSRVVNAMNIAKETVEAKRSQA